MLLGFLDLKFGSRSCDYSDFDRSSVDGFSDASDENTPVKGPASLMSAALPGLRSSPSFPGSRADPARGGGRAGSHARLVCLRIRAGKSSGAGVRRPAAGCPLLPGRPARRGRW